MQENQCCNCAKPHLGKVYGPLLKLQILKSITIPKAIVHYAVMKSGQTEVSWI